MPTVKDYIIEGKEDNVDYCHPYETKDGRCKFVIFDIPEPHICALMVDGEEIGFDNIEVTAQLARMVDEDYEDYKDYGDIRILTEALEKQSCRACPWIDECDVMNIEVD